MAPLGWSEGLDPSIHLFVFICLLRGSLTLFVWDILSDNLYRKGRNTNPPFMTISSLGPAEALDSKATSGRLIE